MISRPPVIPVIVASMLMFIGVIRYCTPPRQIFFLPEGYIGPVVVVFGRDDGVDVREGRDFLFRIDATGVLLVRGDGPPPGMYRFGYFYSNGHDTELATATVPDELQVFHRSDGYTATRDGKPANCAWTAFLVGIPAQRNDWHVVRDHAIKSAVRSACVVPGQDSGGEGVPRQK